MKILKLLSKKNFSIIAILFIGLASFAEEQPVDIWNIEKKKIEEKSSTSEIIEEQNQNVKKNKKTITDIYNLQSQSQTTSIELEKSI